MENEPQDRFKDAMGILIALVALVTALAAWRAAVTARGAGVEDYRAVVSVLNTQETLTLNFASAFQHLTSFTDFAINDELLSRLLAMRTDTLSEQERAVVEDQTQEAGRLAATNRNFFPARYVQKDGTYDLKRELAEQFANAERRQDLVPDAHLERAAALDSKTFGFVQSVVLASVSLLFLTLAGAFHPERRWLRWSAAALGILFLGLGAILTVMTEFF